MKKVIGIRNKIIIGVVLVFIISGVINVTLLINSLYKARVSGMEGIKTMASMNARDNLNSMEQILDLKEEFQGGWHLNGGELYRGNTKMNGNNVIIDEFGKLYKGSTITVFQGKTRVATNVIKDGKRAVGTDVSKAVEERVLVAGKAFYGEANVVGNNYITAYHPIKDADTGKIIGIFYTGIPADEIEKHEITLLASSKKIALGSLLITLAIIGLAIITIFTITSKCLIPLKDMGESFKELASGNGDLTKRIEIKSKDEVGNLGEIVNLFIVSLEKIISNIKILSTSLNNSSCNVSENLDGVAVNVEQIFNSVKEAEMQMNENTASIEEISATIAELSQNATKQMEQALEANKLSGEVHEDSSAGEKMLKDLLKSLERVSETSEKTLEDNHMMKTHSAEILKIVGAIEDIANQTNLLSLNASIEASRAGAAGKGFAVVASEIRTLAANSQSAVEGIKKVASDILSTTEESSVNLIKSEKATKEGVEKASQLEKVIGNTLIRIKEVSLKVENITENTENNTSSLEEVSAAMMTSSQNTSDTSMQISNISESSKQLNSKTSIMLSETQSMINKVEGLYQMISKFKTNS